ncbi:hypothetical protein E1180_04925 [Roseibium denhamense]|uniref:YceI family protein n=1 Tax=Roseibium denhamense TaxID=76305 RepID=A0ABY1NZF3_9HYPH|nr:hypothetical protein [Roseibium denhamense]MTI04856.1 hypothetical protein [Roseibium denhamense]SMP19952.1 hypothetical protein SAMN06265374_2082 [Roseibium denhamense]
MTSWRPATQEPIALQACLYDYLRNRSPKVYLDGKSSVTALGQTTELMSDGQKLTLNLTIIPVGSGKINGRETVEFSVTGQAADKSSGYNVEGRVVIDSKTLAFLAIEATPTVVNIR